MKCVARQLNFLAFYGEMAAERLFHRKVTCCPSLS